MITTWQASQHAPALAATYDQVADLIANDLVSPATFPGFPYPSLVAVEDQPDVTVGREQAKKTLLASSGNQVLRESWFYPSAPRSSHLTCRSSSSRGRWTISSRAACSLRRRSTPVAKSQNATRRRDVQPAPREDGSRGRRQ